MPIKYWWETENAPIYPRDIKASFRRYLMTTQGPIAYITSDIGFPKYKDSFNKDNAEFTWIITWLLNGEACTDGTLYCNRRLADVEQIIIDKLTKSI